MGVKNYLIEGVSCAGKTTVCNELQKRGIMPSMAIGSWHIREIPKRGYRQRGSPMNIIFGIWRK